MSDDGLARSVIMILLDGEMDESRSAVARPIAGRATGYEDRFGSKIYEVARRQIHNVGA